MHLANDIALRTQRQLQREADEAAESRERFLRRWEAQQHNEAAQATAHQPQRLPVVEGIAPMPRPLPPPSPLAAYRVLFRSHRDQS